MLTLIICTTKLNDTNTIIKALIPRNVDPGTNKIINNIEFVNAGLTSSGEWIMLIMRDAFL